MIEAEKSIVIDASVDSVWDYVQDIRRWAKLFPGCRDCTVIDEDHSRWIIKVGAGGLVRTVNVLVHIDQWNGPERVNFSYQLEGDPVAGHGCYIAASLGSHETEITLKVHVEGSGSMAPMWEAVSKPLLPQLASSFAGKLKREIEESGVESQVKAVSDKPSMFGTIINWMRQLWQTVFG